jgi:hypothetical protein
MGAEFPACDPNPSIAERLQNRARKASEQPTIWLDDAPELYGDELARSGEFRAKFSEALTAIWRLGVKGAVTHYSMRPSRGRNLV